MNNERFNGVQCEVGGLGLLSQVLVRAGSVILASMASKKVPRSSIAPWEAEHISIGGADYLPMERRGTPAIPFLERACSPKIVTSPSVSQARRSAEPETPALVA